MTRSAIQPLNHRSVRGWTGTWGCSQRSLVSFELLISFLHTGSHLIRALPRAHRENYGLSPVSPCGRKCQAGRGVFVALVRPGPLGSRKALGHANKATKGALVKRLADTGAVLETVAELVAWGAKEGYEFDPASHHEGRIDLVISGS
jgi:hypothetical protein